MNRLDCGGAGRRGATDGSASRRSGPCPDGGVAPISDDSDVDVVNALTAGLALTLAVLALVLERRDRQRTYLRLSLSLERINPGLIIAHTKIDNAIASVRELDAVFLLLGPEDEEPMQTTNTVLSHTDGVGPACCPIDLRRCLPTSPTGGADGIRRMLPLPYYTAENINVADELLTYSHSIDVSELPAGPYSVRMYVYGKQRLYRLVQALIIQPEPTAAAPPPTAPPQRATTPELQPTPTPPCAKLRHCPRRG
jgi:hypothetical protein